MLEHLKAQIGDKDTKDMTADELQFYYFNYGSKKVNFIAPLQKNRKILDIIFCWQRIF